MSKSAFASLIINKMKAAISTDGQSFNEGTATAAMAAVAQAITEYLIANTVVSVAYVGIIPGVPPVPDPLVADTFKIVGACAPPGPSNNFDAWMFQLQNNIIAGFQLAPMGNTGLVFPTKPFLAPGVITNQAMLTSAHDVGDEDSQQKIWEIVCEGIMQWINTTAINPVPGPGSRPTSPSTGTANIVKITLV